MAQNINNPKEMNPNFDKQYYDRETERMDFLDRQERGNDLNFEDYFKESDKIRMYAGDPSTQVRIIKDGS